MVEREDELTRAEFKEKIRAFKTFHYDARKDAVVETIVVTQKELVPKLVKRYLSLDREIKCGDLLVEPFWFLRARELRSDVRSLKKSLEATRESSTKERIQSYDTLIAKQEKKLAEAEPIAKKELKDILDCIETKKLKPEEVESSAPITKREPPPGYERLTRMARKGRQKRD